MTGTSTAVTVAVYDGDNSLASTNPWALVCAECVVGETPAEYVATSVSSLMRAHTVLNLHSGRSYYVRVSAHNARGYGTLLASTPSSLAPPAQVPGVPTAASLDVVAGSNSQVQLAFAAPASDGGDPILKYKVEWSTVSTFATALSGTVINTASQTLASDNIRCASNPIQEVWQVSTAATSDAVNGGAFTLTLAAAGQTLTTGLVDYNAVPMEADETTATDELYCTSSVTACPVNTPHTAVGSLQAQLEALANVVSGVKVERATTDGGNTYVWMVTFMDAGSDFTLTVASSTLTNSAAGTSSAAVAQAVDGKTFGSCTGSVIINGLTQGTPYYARVSAANKEGYGVPTVVTTSQKPMVPPGLPTAVSVSLVSSTSLRVYFSNPLDDGGDSVTEYLIEADPLPSFDSSTTGDSTVNGESVSAFYHNQFKYLSAGSPFHHTISGLTKGQAYYFRVRAYNSRGYGSVQPSSPAYDVPRELPAAPTNVQMQVTSPTMLTVSWEPPLDNGGEAITQYKVEWDITATFTSLNVAPNKGSKIITDPTQRYATIDSLTAGTTYYARIFAMNSVGYGTNVRTTPTLAIPASMLPGRPTQITATATSSAGQITVQWHAPIVPYHQLFCAGTATVPAACPATMAHGTEADGGSEISQYLVEWDNGQFFNSSSTAPYHSQTYVAAWPSYSAPYSHTITGLSNTEDTWVRVFAINANGQGLTCAQAADGTTGRCTGAQLYGRPL